MFDLEDYDNNFITRNTTRNKCEYVILYLLYVFIYVITFVVFFPLSYYIYDEYWITNHITEF